MPSPNPVPLEVSIRGRKLVDSGAPPSFHLRHTAAGAALQRLYAGLVVWLVACKPRPAACLLAHTGHLVACCGAAHLLAPFQVCQRWTACRLWVGLQGHTQAVHAVQTFKS